MHGGSPEAQVVCDGVSSFMPWTGAVQCGRHAQGDLTTRPGLSTPGSASPAIFLAPQIADLSFPAQGPSPTPVGCFSTDVITVPTSRAATCHVWPPHGSRAPASPSPVGLLSQGVEPQRLPIHPECAADTPQQLSGSTAPWLPAPLRPPPSRSACGHTPPP